MSGSYPNPKPPLQSVMIATLTVFAFDAATDDEAMTVARITSTPSGSASFQWRVKRLIPVALLG